MSLRDLSDEELLRLAGRTAAPAPRQSLSSLSDDELLRMAGRARPAPAQASTEASSGVLENIGSIAQVMNPAAGLINMVTGQRAQGAGAALQQGVTMGWADELQAAQDAARAAVLGQRRGVSDLVAGRGSAYDESMAEQQREREAFSQSNPMTAGAAELAGGILGAGKIGSGVAAGRALMQSIPRLAGIGAASGAVSGAGTANPGDRASGAASGALIGGLAGPAVAGGVAAGSAIGRALRNALGLNPNAADEVVIAALGRDETTPAMLRQALQDAPQGTPRSIAGVGGTNLRGALSGAAVAPGRAQREVTQAAESRMADQPARVREAVSEASGPREYAADLLQETKRQRWASAAPLYDEAYAVGSIADPVIMDILRKPQFAKAFERAERIAELEGRRLPKLYRDGELVSVPDVQSLDYIKRGIDDTISTGFSTGGMGSAEAAALKKLRNDMIERLDRAVPAYARARASYAGDSEVLSAIEDGAKALNMTAGALKLRVRAMRSDAEREAFRKAALDSLNDRMSASADGRLLGDLLKSEKQREVLRLIVDNDEEYARLTNRLMAERSEADMLRRVNPTVGSQTAIRQGDAGALPETAQAVTNAATGNVQGLIGQAMRWLQQKGSGLTDEQRGMMAQDLLSNDPARQRAVLLRIEEVTSRVRADAAAREGRRGGAAAVAGAVPGLLGGG